MAKKSTTKSSVCACDKPICACSIPTFIMGVGLGALLTYPVFGSHPVKWGVALIAIGLIWYFLQSKVKNN